MTQCGMSIERNMLEVSQGSVLQHLTDMPHDLKIRAPVCRRKPRCFSTYSIFTKSCISFSAFTITATVYKWRSPIGEDNVVVIV